MFIRRGKLLKAMVYHGTSSGRVLVTRLLVVGTLLCFASRVVAAGEQCFDSIGSLDDTTFPCSNSTSSGSSCCSSGDVCWSTGLCSGRENGEPVFRQGSCTDPTNASENCLKRCLGSSELKLCGTANEGNTYCCGRSTSDCCSSPNVFELPLGTRIGQISSNISTVSMSQTMTTLTSTSMSSMTTTFSTSITMTATTIPTVIQIAVSSPSDQGPILGLALGLGIPLGLCLLAVLIFLIYRNLRQPSNREAAFQAIQHRRGRSSVLTHDGLILPTSPPQQNNRGRALALSFGISRKGIKGHFRMLRTGKSENVVRAQERENTRAMEERGVMFPGVESLDAGAGEAAFMYAVAEAQGLEHDDLPLTPASSHVQSIRRGRFIEHT